MEQMYTVSRIAGLLGCSTDTARARMKEMPGVMNVGSAKRRQLMVPESGLQDWLRNHRMAEAERPLRVTISADGKMARIDRRTGKLTTASARATSAKSWTAPDANKKRAAD